MKRSWGFLEKQVQLHLCDGHTTLNSSNVYNSQRLPSYHHTAIEMYKLVERYFKESKWLQTKRRFILVIRMDSTTVFSVWQIVRGVESTALIFLQSHWNLQMLRCRRSAGAITTIFTSSKMSMTDENGSQTVKSVILQSYSLYRRSSLKCRRTPSL